MVSTAYKENNIYRLTTSVDLDPLIEKIGAARFVLLGEASHGTHEYYAWRTAISKRLIEEKGFSFIAVEGDWPDCYKINRFIKGYHESGVKILDVLKEFRRWPTWMWANWEIAALAEWLQAYNARRRHMQDRVGFYGLDVYSLWESMDVIVSYLKKEDPGAADVAIKALHCFEPFEDAGEDYAKAVYSMSADCTDEVVRLLKAVRERSPRYDHDIEAPLNASMNAKVIADAERYYRSMVSFRDQSWNIRDYHMTETLNDLIKFHEPNAKAIVWEHNTHVGDARYTDMRSHGMINVGQLVREQYARDAVFIVGFASYTGSVIAGSRWGGNMEEMFVPPALNGSIEDILHRESDEDRLLLLDEPLTKEKFNRYLGHRAIGVVYHPDREKGNYVPTLLPSRYDALMYIDQTEALHPLRIKADKHEMPETYPFTF